VGKLNEELKEQDTKNKQVAAECATRTAELGEKNEEIRTLQAESRRITELKDKVNKRIEALEAQKNSTDAQRDELKNEVTDSEVEIQVQKRERENERKTTDDLVRERDILNKNLVKAQNATSSQVDLIKIHENTKRNLEVEIAAFRTSAADLGRQIKKLSTEKERYSAEAQDAADRYAQALDAVKEREINVLQLQKKIA